MAWDSAKPVRRFARIELLVVVIVIYLVSILVTSFPALLFGLGINSLGDELGWWVGDPNLNDDDYSIALPLGGIVLVAISLFAAIFVKLAARRYAQRPSPWIIAGSVVLVTAFAIIATLVATA